ncbi:YjiG family protein [Azotosporobacter soli]|uniref:YjiG family protein n=1 Tax=Azotosporobacter soli TaxID=3055040 RepID=UPI0031FE5006
MMEEIKDKRNVLDMFMDGARNGYRIGVHNLIPALVMAFVLIRVLEVTGLLKVVGDVCGPVMMMWGLPGEAAAVILASVMSMGGAVGVAASLYTSGHLTSLHISALLPAIYLMGNPVQNVGRVLGLSETNPRHYAAILAIGAINAMLSIWVMQLLLQFIK